jgi:hypothetical protein
MRTWHQFEFLPFFLLATPRRYNDCYMRTFITIYISILDPTIIIESNTQPDRKQIPLRIPLPVQSHTLSKFVEALQLKRFISRHISTLFNTSRLIKYHSFDQNLTLSVCAPK